MTEPTTPEVDAAPASATGDPWVEAVALVDAEALPAGDVVAEAEAEAVDVAVEDALEAEEATEAREDAEVVADAEQVVEAEAEAEVVAALEDADAVETAEQIVDAEAAEIEAETAEAAAAAPDAEDDDDVDPVEAFREATRIAPGDWYVVHSYAGYENRVKANLESRITSLNMEEHIFQVEVPVEEVTEIKNGVRKLVKRNKFPGYVLVRCDLTDESWGAVRHTPGVTGFVGHGHQPSPLSLDEVVGILAPKPEKKPGAAPEKGTPRVVDFEVGDPVTIIEGAFGTMQASISEINPDTQKVIVMVELFGRETPVELTFAQIEKS